MDLLEVVPAERGRSHFPELDGPERKAPPALKTILLAEDDDDLRYVMECCLRSMGYVVVPCADAQLASTAFRSQPAIDVLLTDFDMPGKSGIELARELTALRPALPVVMVTGSLLSSDTMQELHDRRWTYVSKPCRLSALESILGELLVTERPAALA